MNPHLLMANPPPLGEFSREPILTVACVLLIVVSVAWIVTSRLIWIQLRRAAALEKARSRRSASGRRESRKTKPTATRRYSM
jgi:hypothetical protein